jgi:type II secretion system (T2SS) protein G
VANDIRALDAQLDSYKDVKGVYPASLSELKSVPADAWGQKYIYRVPGLHNRDDYDLFSAGPRPQA